MMPGEIVPTIVTHPESKSGIQRFKPLHLSPTDVVLHLGPVQSPSFVGCPQGPDSRQPP